MPTGDPPNYCPICKINVFKLCHDSYNCGNYANFINADNFTLSPLTLTIPEKLPFKYDEQRLLDEFREYLLKTYNQHYVGKDNVQSIDLIMSAGHGEGFYIGNILKYAARYKKKVGEERKDLWKILHYALLQVYLHDQENQEKQEEHPERT